MTDYDIIVYNGDDYEGEVNVKNLDDNTDVHVNTMQIMVGG